MTSDGPLSGKTLGRYRLGSLLGRGGMGEVYRADDTELRRPVAIKVLPQAFTADADRLARFIQEARTASALNHPHLVSIYEIGQAHSIHFIAMELVQGDTLRQLFDARRTDLKRTLEYLAQAADALAAAHAAGIVHRDLKPENLMIAEGGYAKVLDFGLAKLRGESIAAGALGNEATMTAGPELLPGAGTSPGVVMGTVGYMSPEQAQGQPVDHRSDIFSFGCIVYEAVTGARPFAGTSAVDTLHRIIHVQPQAIAQLAPSAPYELQRIVRKCLAKSPDERYQTIKDVALDLRDLRRELESGSSPSLAVVPPASTSGTKLGRVITALAVAATLAAAAYWLWQPGDRRAPLAGLTLERITATGLVIDAVISPDGNYVAYVESEKGQQKLLLRQTRGARPLELSAPPGGFWGVEFSKDGSAIYYVVKNSTETLGTLYSIPVLGGTPRALLSGIDSKVTFSPDGKRIAYVRVEPDGTGASSLMIADASGQNPRPLVTKRLPEFLAPGFFSAPSWSPDGERIAAAVRNSETRDARLVTFGASDGAEEVFPHPYADATFTNWLPDGSAIVVVGRMPGMFTTGNGGQLWLQPYPSGDVRRLTADMLEYRTASLTADGESLLSVAFEATARLSLLRLEGRVEQRLPEDRFAGGTGVAWSPDGRRIFYVKNVRGELQVWTMAIDGSDARDVVTKVRPSGIAVSPDGRWIVYGAERDGSGGIWRAEADGSNPRLLAPAADAMWLAMAPDGRQVYFTSWREGSPATFRVSTDGGVPVRVASLLERAAPSRDGRLLAGIYREHPQAAISLGVLDAADGTVVHLIPNFAPAVPTGAVGWLPDSKTLIYTTAERSNLWKQPAAGGPPEKVTDFQDQVIVRFALSPDGRTLALCRGSVTRDAVLLRDFR